VRLGSAWLAATTVQARVAEPTTVGAAQVPIVLDVAATVPHPVPSTVQVTARSLDPDTAAVKRTSSPLTAVKLAGEMVTETVPPESTVYVADATALSRYPAACASARTVAVALTVKGAA
jgi:hypothetical protein